MTVIQTGENYDQWSINIDNYALQDVLDYVNALTFGSEEVRKITIAPCNSVVVVNGISKVFDNTDELAEFSTTMGTYTTNNEGNKVKCAWYFADKAKVEIEYDHHPMDPKPFNSTHDIADLQSWFEAMFALWKSKVIEATTQKMVSNASFS